MNVNNLNTKQAAEAVKLFNAEYAEMERALFCLSKHCRSALLDGENLAVVEALVWNVKCWWGVQGVKSETRVLAAQALSQMNWSSDDFDEKATVSADADIFAYERVTELVSKMVSLGVGRQEFSLSSKVLHWLLPWRIPVYDSFVRKSIGIPTTWNHHEAYREIVRWQFSATRRLVADDSSWIGDVVPMSPLRALDKYLWWLGGGAESKAVVAREPWKIINQLGLQTS